jgi:hypothetical protein
VTSLGAAQSIDHRDYLLMALIRVDRANAHKEHHASFSCSVESIRSDPCRDSRRWPPLKMFSASRKRWI